MSCDACLSCPHSSRLWKVRWLPGIAAYSTTEHFRLSDWWHFREWLSTLLGWWAHKLIAPKDPKGAR
jgi:hypothetical protein